MAIFSMLSVFGRCHALRGQASRLSEGGRARPRCEGGLTVKGRARSGWGEVVADGEDGTSQDVLQEPQVYVAGGVESQDRLLHIGEEGNPPWLFLGPQVKGVLVTNVDRHAVGGEVWSWVRLGSSGRRNGRTRGGARPPGELGLQQSQLAERPQQVPGWWEAVGLGTEWTMVPHRPELHWWRLAVGGSPATGEAQDACSSGGP